MGLTLFSTSDNETKQKSIQFVYCVSVSVILICCHVQFLMYILFMLVHGTCKISKEITCLFNVILLSQKVMLAVQKMKTCHQTVRLLVMRQRALNNSTLVISSGDLIISSSHNSFLYGDSPFNSA